MNIAMKIIGAAWFIAAILLPATLLILGGCVQYKGAKVTEGTNLSIGLDVPGTDGAAQISILNYLSGFRVGVAEGAKMKLEYSVSETNSYLGVVHTCVGKKVDAMVEPIPMQTSEGEKL